MCCVEVASAGASFEDSNAVAILDGKIPEEAYEPDLVINLVKHKHLRFANAFIECIPSTQASTT